MITSEYGDCDEDYVDTSLGLHFPRLQFDDDSADVRDDYEDDDDDDDGDDGDDDDDDDDDD